MEPGEGFDGGHALPPRRPFRKKMPIDRMQRAELPQLMWMQKSQEKGEMGPGYSQTALSSSPASIPYSAFGFGQVTSLL